MSPDSSTLLKTTTICNIKIHDIELTRALSIITDWLSAPGKPRLVVTPNIYLISQVLEKPCVQLGSQTINLADIYAAADLSLNDSRVLRLLTIGTHSRINNACTGSDLTAQLLGNGVLQNKRILIVGGEQRDFEQLQDRFSLQRAFHINPSMGFIHKPDEVQQILEHISNTEYDVIFSAVGSPAKEVISYLVYRQSKGCPVILSIGAALDFLTGKETRAPKLLQRLSLEWLWRAALSPRRLGARYAKLATKIWKIRKAMQ